MICHPVIGSSEERKSEGNQTSVIHAHSGTWLFVYVRIIVRPMMLKIIDRPMLLHLFDVFVTRKSTTDDGFRRFQVAVSGGFIEPFLPCDLGTRLQRLEGALELHSHRE